jgi:hypothetical protein
LPVHVTHGSVGERHPSHSRHLLDHVIQLFFGSARAIPINSEIRVQRSILGRSVLSGLRIIAHRSTALNRSDVENNQFDAHNINQCRTNSLQGFMSSVKPNPDKPLTQ